MLKGRKCWPVRLADAQSNMATMKEIVAEDVVNSAEDLLRFLAHNTTGKDPNIEIKAVYTHRSSLVSLLQDLARKTEAYRMLI
jgi:hypothetical protein